MSTLTIISVIVNFGLLILVLSLFRTRIVSRYKRVKKQREIQEHERIKRIVLQYLKELQND